MAYEISRRDVLKGAAAGAVGLATAKIAFAAVPDKRLRFGIIGCGGKGWSGMMEAARFGEIAAIADIDMNARTAALKEFPNAASFEDYRVLLGTMSRDLDAVVVSTPDHHHFPAAAMAMKAGLHCYCEKPLTRTLWEARELAQIARVSRVATQMGNQSTASTPMRKVASLIRAGRFGRVKGVHLWTDRAAGWWPQGVHTPPPKLSPKNIDFNLWLGPRPNRYYADGYHPFAWRGWWDFGTGSLGDMGCHIFNMPFMALDLRDPVAVIAETSGNNKESFPSWSIVHYEFPSRRGRGEVELHWYDGGKKPAASLAPGHEYGGNGVIVVCENATIFSPDESNSKFVIVEGGEIPDVKIDESPGHMAEFARAALGGPAAVSNFPNYAGPLTETVLLGNLAIWADGKRVEWDARNLHTRGTSEFDSLIHPTFRIGWEV